MKNEIITHEDPKSPISEVFKTLRTNLQFMSNKKDGAISLLITSTMPGEGKSWVSSNLGTAFAQTNKKVILIDSDMRKGRLHSIFETKIFPGLSNYLADESSKIENYIIPTEIENLSIIPAGNVPPNPSELLSSEKMLKGLEDLQKMFDVIIFDSTPCMLVTDAVIISRIVDATIIVSSHKSTKIENLKEVQKNIENVGGKIAGVIINKVPVSLKKYKSKYYYYGDRTKVENTKKEEQKPINEESYIVKEGNTEWIDVKQESVEVKEKKDTEKNNQDDDILNQINEYLDNKE